MSRTRARAKKKQPPKKSNRILFVAFFAAVVVIVAGLYHAFQPHPVAAPVAIQTDVVGKISTTPPPPIQVPSPETSSPIVLLIGPKELLQNLLAIDGKEPVTAEAAQKWKASLQQLIHGGAASIANIQQWLAQNQDVNYSGVQGAGALGYSSLRGALIDALGQIGGPDADSALLQVMQGSVYPTDVAAIAKILDTASPGQYLAAILDVVHQQLGMAALDQLGGANVGPLFQVLAIEAAAGAAPTVAGELAQFTDNWPFYSVIAMAALPDNAGVPGLIQMAQGTLPGNQAVAAQALAELAPQNADAFNMLLQMAKSGQLTDNVLAQIAPFMGGRQYELSVPSNNGNTAYLTMHIASGNQDFAAYDPTLTPAQITQRESIIDQMLQNLPPDYSSAQSALQAQRTALQAKEAK